MMTRKDFDALAAPLKAFAEAATLTEVDKALFKQLLRDVAAHCKKQNENFDSNKFAAAAGFLDC